MIKKGYIYFNIYIYVYFHTVLKMNNLRVYHVKKMFGVTLLFFSFIKYMKNSEQGRLEHCSKIDKLIWSFIRNRNHKLSLINGKKAQSPNVFWELN